MTSIRPVSLPPVADSSSPPRSAPSAAAPSITIVSTGNEGNIGANKLTGEMTKIAAQVPALFEALSGMNLKDLMGNIKAMKPREEDKETK